MFSEPIVYEAEILDSRYKKKGVYYVIPIN